MNFTPLRQWIFVKKDFTEKTTSGIILPHIKEERPVTGKVISIGPEVTSIKQNDKIHFHYAAGTTFEYLGEKVSIIHENDVSGIYENT